MKKEAFGITLEETLANYQSGKAEILLEDIIRKSLIDYLENFYDSDKLTDQEAKQKRRIDELYIPLLKKKEIVGDETYLERMHELEATREMIGNDISWYYEKMITPS